jgi:AraC-like DNA-binding protein
MSTVKATSGQPPRTLNAAYARIVLQHVQQVRPQAMAAFTAEQLAYMDQVDTLDRCPLTEWHQLMNTAETTLQRDDLLPVLSEAFKPWHAGLVGLTLMTCGTIGEVGGLLRRLYTLLNDVFLLERGLVNGRFFLRLKHATHEQSPRLARLSLMMWAQRLKWLAGRDDLVLDATFEGAPPDDVRPYERIFGGKVTFNSQSNAMCGPDVYLALPIVSRDTASNGLLQQQVLQQLDLLRQGESYFKDKLQRVIRSRLSEGTLTLACVATELKLSPRTLQRRLEDAGLNFRLMVDDVRNQQAQYLLSKTDMALTDMSEALGFSDNASFNRAFKRWTGHSPGAYRRLHGTASSDVTN